MLGRDVIIGSERLFWILDEIGRIRPQSLNKIYVSEELEAPAPIPLKSVSLRDEVLRNPENYTLLIEPIGLLQALRKLKI
ncbi:MAG: hypothetical protein QXR17_06040 [Candidatus Bathyarchaeia archaeon]